ncbi:hypothetical protein DFS34DRAFT_357205 [Phlyctochytrium arcticum]|nr:hypothetical protein DFS34DRAFT_357205 [Phlyctochytrium arcticum]
MQLIPFIRTRIRRIPRILPRVLAAVTLFLPGHLERYIYPPHRLGLHRFPVSSVKEARQWRGAHAIDKIFLRLILNLINLLINLLISCQACLMLAPHKTIPKCRTSPSIFCLLFSTPEVLHTMTAPQTRAPHLLNRPVLLGIQEIPTTFIMAPSREPIPRNSMISSCLGCLDANSFSGISHFALATVLLLITSLLPLVMLFSLLVLVLFASVFPQS